MPTLMQTTVELNSSSNDPVREEYETKNISDRGLAKKVGISDTALRKRAKKGGWVKFQDDVEIDEPYCNPDRSTPRLDINGMTKPVTTTTIGQLTELGRDLLLELMAELKFLNRHADVLTELVEAHFSGEKDDRIRSKLTKALDHETRTRSSAQLASALQKLNDAAPAPGKKEQAQADAETAGRDSGWGADLGIGSGPPAGVARHPN